MPELERDGSAPSRVGDLLREADSRIWQKMEQRRGDGLGFVASDFTLVNAALERVVADQLAQGNLFCEWGSGFGVVTMLASLLGFDAYGIEIQSDLVQAAEELAADARCDVRFAQGSFLTARDGDLIAAAKHPWWESTETNAYEELDIEPEEFDVFFGYPWPGEEELFDLLFMRHASIGALLLTFHGSSGVLAQRKTKTTGPPAVVCWC